MTTLDLLSRAPIISSICISLLVGLSILGLRNLGHLESLELAAYDQFIRARTPISGLNTRIALIGVTESDISAMGRWPISDALMGQILTTLMQYEPRAVGLDIYRDVKVPPGRDELNEVFTRYSSIVVPMHVGGEGKKGVDPPPVLSGTEQVGFNDILVDRGGIVRRGLLFQDYQGTTHYAFALRLALLYLQAEGIYPQSDPTNPEAIRLGQTTIRRFGANDGGYIEADALGYQFLLDFQEVQEAFPVFTLSNLLAGKVLRSAIHDKIVIIGTIAESVHDEFFTPFSLGLDADQQMPGAVLHASIASQLLRSALDGTRSVRVLSDALEWDWVLLWSALGAVIGLRLLSPWRFVLVVGGGLALLVFGSYVAFIYGWWIPLVPPVITWMLSAVIVTASVSYREAKQRALMQQLFERHSSPQVVNAIWEQRHDFIRNGRPRSERMVLTVLFTDLVGFTTISEKMEPQELVDWLDQYMEAMAPHVINHHGVILRFTGDGILAVFGAPLARNTEEEIGQDAIGRVPIFPVRLRAEPGA
ncbi:CHASE2 domain-containing protein, partial [Candidatus Entotheonella palauensis]|uniref:CHASE2 domain-containing protein n=1 Tax=Candidatus Entotheonella palauensis TaxID=93172 RepID=UPI00117784B7